jgi:hypothetical protein
VFQRWRLDFKRKQFHLWDSDYLIQNPLYTTVIIINRNFYESFSNRDEESIKEVNEKIFDEHNKGFLNPNGTITSWFLQDVERQVLEKMYEFLKEETYYLNHCGFMF